MVELGLSYLHPKGSVDQCPIMHSTSLRHPTKQLSIESSIIIGKQLVVDVSKRMLSRINSV